MISLARARRSSVPLAPTPLSKLVGASFWNATAHHPGTPSRTWVRQGRLGREGSHGSDGASLATVGSPSDPTRGGAPRGRKGGLVGTDANSEPDRPGVACAMDRQLGQAARLEGSQRSISQVLPRRAQTLRCTENQHNTVKIVPYFRNQPQAQHNARSQR
jgi:hypothetical protein